MSKTNLWSDAQKLIEKPIESRSPFKGNLLHLHKDKVQLPNGESSFREWIEHPGACAVVPVFDDGTIMLVKQFRYPVGQVFLEVPAGKIDPGEPPRQTAIRETEEETGVVPGSIAYAGHFYPVIGYSDEIIHIYVAWNLRSRENNRDRDEFLVNTRIPWKEALGWVETGDITDSKTIVALCKAKSWWKKEQPFQVDFG